jgi:SET domain-containing protein
MKLFVVKRAGGKGNGLFAYRDITKGRKIFDVDLSKKKSYSEKEIAKNPKLQSNHCDYFGRGRYVISFHPYSYMNHSCNPNILVKHMSIARSTFVAMRDIKKGEELTYDYGTNAMDQFDKDGWTLDCKCGNENCRKKIPGDFFKQPKEIQRRYFKYLPPSLKRKYKNRI